MGQGHKRVQKSVDKLKKLYVSKHGRMFQASPSHAAYMFPFIIIPYPLMLNSSSRMPWALIGEISPYLNLN